ncbi:MAG TPA: hypothetical protein PLQ35_15170 [bacterium]|nr:hypothetical protein [bacterium]HQL63624.1 hypothetical protein [bacterium]
MNDEIPYDDLRYGLLNTQYLIDEIDFAMWLQIEYHGQSETTPLSLIKKPKEEVAVEVDALLPERRQALMDYYSFLRCPRCGTEYHEREDYKTCPYKSTPYWRIKEEGIPSKDIMKLADETCGATLETVFPDDVEKRVRDEVETEILVFSDSLLTLRHEVLWWIADILYPGKPKPEEIELSLREVFRYLGTMVEKEVDEIHFHLPQFGDVLNLSGRRNILPAGNTLAEKHRDYLSIRSKIITLHARLSGIEQRRPDHEDSVFFERPGGFRPPIELPESIPFSESDSITEPRPFRAQPSISSDLIPPQDPADDWRWSGLPLRLERLAKVLEKGGKMKAADIKNKIENGEDPSRIMADYRKHKGWGKWISQFIGHERPYYWLITRR